MKYLFLFGCFGLISISLAQKKSDADTAYKRFIVMASIGASTDIKPHFSINEWEKMTPGVSIPDSLKLDMNPSHWKSKDPIGETGSNFFLFSFSLITSKPEHFYQASTRFYLGTGSRIQSSRIWGNEVVTPIDTLVSSVTGDSYFVEEIRSARLVKSYRSNSILFGIGERIATNPRRIFQFETGLDLLAFVSLFNTVQSEYMEVSELRNAPDSYSFVLGNTQESVFQSFKGKIVSGMILRIPLDFSFALSKKRAFLKNMRLGWELNPGLNVTFSGLQLSRLFYMSGGFNLRVKL